MRMFRALCSVRKKIHPSRDGDCRRGVGADLSLYFVLV